MTTRVGIALLIVLALAVVPLGTVGTPSPAGDAVVHGTSDGSPVGGVQATSGANALTRTTTLALRPAEPGRIRAEVGFSLPDQVVELTTAVPEDASVVGRNGFRNAGDGNYSWDGETDRPSLTLSLQVNRTGTYHQRSTAAGEGGTMFADTGDWAIASVPSAPVWWSSLRSEPPVTFVRETAVKGEGVAGDRMAYLGPHTSRTRTIDGQEITLVVPEVASLEPSPGAVFEALSAASSGLPSSPVPESLVIAAPTTVDWGPFGLADGSDTWVRADQPLDVPGTVWIHEFVHLRQDFRTTAETRWLREGMPEYYAALFALEAGQIDFDEFAAHLDRGTRSRYADVVLAEPDSWTGLANYAKGALVYGDLDRRIRTAAAGSAAALQVFAAMNEHAGPVDQSFLVEQVTAVSDGPTAATLDQFTTASRTPSMWSADAHQSAFGTAPPKIVTEFGDSVRISGPYRNRTAAESPVLVPGERVTIPVTVRNEGEATGEYQVRLQADEQVVASANGSLAGGEKTDLDLSHTVVSPGTVTLMGGPKTWAISVREPAKPVVGDVSVDEPRVRVGESVTVTATIQNPGPIPADGELTLLLDGDPVVEWPVSLEENESVSRRTTVEILSEGDHTLSLGNRSLTVEGARETAVRSTTVPPGTTGTHTPGFTASIAVLAWLGMLGVLYESEK